MKKPRAKPRTKRPRATQSQHQHITVNISKPSSRRTSQPSKAKPQEKEQPKSYMSMMPSFNVNQPQPASDLAKLVGLLIPKLQTESTLAKAIPTNPIIAPVSKKPKIADLKSNIDESTLGIAIDTKQSVLAQPYIEEEEVSKKSFRQYPELQPIEPFMEYPEEQQSNPFMESEIKVSHLKVPNPKKPKSGESSAVLESLQPEKDIRSFFPVVKPKPFYGQYEEEPESSFGIGPVEPEPKMKKERKKRVSKKTV